MQRTKAQILEDVAAAFGCDVSDILGPSKHQSIVRVRFAACWVLQRVRPDLSPKEIGETIRRERTTVVYAIERANDLLQTDPDFRRDLFAAARIEDEPPPPPTPASLLWPYMRGRYAHVRTA